MKDPHWKLPATDSILWKRIRLGSSLHYQTADLKKKKCLQTKTRPYYSRGLSDMPANALWPRQGEITLIDEWDGCIEAFIGYPRQAIAYNEKCKPKHEILFPSIQPPTLGNMTPTKLGMTDQLALRVHYWPPKMEEVQVDTRQGRYSQINLLQCLFWWRQTSLRLPMAPCDSEIK